MSTLLLLPNFKRINRKNKNRCWDFVRRKDLPRNANSRQGPSHCTPRLLHPFGEEEEEEDPLYERVTPYIEDPSYHRVSPWLFHT